MSTATSYREYVADQSFMTQYSSYQQKYAAAPRESDRVLLGIIADLVGRAGSRTEPLSLLDIGCSTGNFLRHLRNAVPNLRLVGGDAAASVVQQCREDASLTGMEFLVSDILDLGAVAEYDFVVANAVTYLFDEKEYAQCLRSVQRALKPGGWFLSFEWIHPFHQELRIIETSASHPEGLPIHARSIHTVQRVLSECGFENIVATPFEIPIDLTCSGDQNGFESISTRTIRASDGKRMMFRGALYQPWSHLQAQKLS